MGRKGEGKEKGKRGGEDKRKKENESGSKRTVLENTCFMSTVHIVGLQPKTKKNQAFLGLG